MTENRFLAFVLTESILLLCLGFCMLILPKVSIISFGLIMCFSYFVYGGYKVISAILTKNFSRHFILDIITGLVLVVTGLILYILPVFDLMLIIAFAGIYFVLKSISTSAFGVQTRKTLNFWWMCLFLAMSELFFGGILIVLLPSAALWLVGMFTGVDFILSGMVYMNMYISTKYMQGG